MKAVNTSGAQIQYGRSKELGRLGEARARRYLEHDGYVVLDQNWRCARGELDLVVYDPKRDALVAVEVKTRRSRRSGTPEEAITSAKLLRLRSLIMEWAYAHACHAARLEVDAICLLLAGGQWSLNHLKSL